MPTSHEELFSEYVNDLEWAVNEATVERNKDLARLEKRFGGDRARAMEAFSSHGPLCADPYVMGAVRQYWLACDELNRRAPANALEPEIFIREWLRPVRPDLSAVIEEYPYWPIGQDWEGRWV
jgi:hypothetical protein